MSNRARKKDKAKFTDEDKLAKKRIYEKFISKYYKGQFCTYYLRGVCWKKDCQFAHGPKDLDFEMFFKLVKDKKEGKFDNLENVTNIQKSYYVDNTNRIYHILFEFQNANKHLFKTLYTFDQLNELNAKRRVEVRKVFHRVVFEDFCHLLFDKLGQLTIDDFDFYFNSLGFVYNFRHFSSKFLFQRTEVDKKTKKKKSIIKLLPDSSTMYEDFKKVLLTQLKEDRSLVPISFKKANNIVNKNIDFEKPLINTYIKAKNIIANDFIKELKEDESFVKNIREILGSDYTGEIFHEMNTLEFFGEFKESLWENYFGSLGWDMCFGLMDFSYISTNYLSKIKEAISESFNEQSLNMLIKKVLLSSRNLVFTNNNNVSFIFNFKHFDALDVTSYLHSDYNKRCNLTDKEVIEQIEKVTNIEEWIILVGELIEKLASESGIDSFLEEYAKFSVEYEEKDTLVINDLSSLRYFTSLVPFFKEIAVDLEGSLSGEFVSINLLQIYDQTSQKVFIIDVFQFHVLDASKKKHKEVFNLLKTVLTFIFESEGILKVFHDGRCDNNALHRFFSIHTSNYVDTACVFTALKQFELQSIELNTRDYLKKVELKDIISDRYNNEFSILFHQVQQAINPGLNKVLENFESNRRVNILKEKYHGIFGDPALSTKLLETRPLDSEFTEYAALDVKYLLDALKNMKEELCKILKTIHVDPKIVNMLVLLLSHEHLNSSC